MDSVRLEMPGKVFCQDTKWRKRDAILKSKENGKETFYEKKKSCNADGCADDRFFFVGKLCFSGIHRRHGSNGGDSSGRNRSSEPGDRKRNRADSDGRNRAFYPGGSGSGRNRGADRSGRNRIRENGKCCYGKYRRRGVCVGKRNH